MTVLEETSKAYLAKLCKLSNLKLLSETEQDISFKVKSRDFLDSFDHMTQQFGDYKAYPVSTDQIDAVWTIAPGQHIIYRTQFQGTKLAFSVVLLKAPEYTPSKLAQDVAQLNQAYDTLTQTSAWQNLGDKDPNKGTIFDQIKAVENEAKKLGLTRN
jgi:hypothetical protein